MPRRAVSCLAPLAGSASLAEVRIDGVGALSGLVDVVRRNPGLKASKQTLLGSALPELFTETGIIRKFKRNVTNRWYRSWSRHPRRH